MTCRTAELLIELREATNLNIEVRHWADNYHVMVNGRHKFAGPEVECQAFLYGMKAMHKLQLK